MMRGQAPKYFFLELPLLMLIGATKLQSTAGTDNPCTLRRWFYDKCLHFTRLNWSIKRYSTLSMIQFLVWLKAPPSWLSPNWFVCIPMTVHAVPALDSWRPPLQIQLWGPVFNIQEKITVHFHTRVYIHTGQAQWQYCKWGSWGRGQQKPPCPPARGSGGAL